ncbi:MAG: histidine kinase [Verrucomicrobia bacterium]|nr:histidine kinase [Verrucomicrobiota bacterium]
MQPALTTEVLEDDAPRRQRAKERLYVICQTAGWGLFLILQITFMRVFWSRRPPTADEQLSDISIIVMVILEGLLVSHYTRALTTRWGWKRLGWRALLPRLLFLSLVQSAVWSLAGYGYTHGLLRLPVRADVGLGISISVSVINGAIMFSGWWCVYMLYHVFHRLEIERLRTGAASKEAELRALKAQVNPHFIFNSLNSLRALIDEDPARARQSVTQLANLLRYSLQSGQLETVPFEDELGVVNDYLALEQVRHEERLRVRLDIDPEALPLPVPPMLLQTLVENAVKYGISTRAEGGEIAIIARCERGMLHLQVTNPGELATAETKTRAVSTGVGLRNAAERLRLLFGETATLRLRAESPSLVVAEAVLPLQLHRA